MGVEEQKGMKGYKGMKKIARQLANLNFLLADKLNNLVENQLSHSM